MTAPVPSPSLIEAVWAHGRTLPEADSAEWRQDACGAWIRREHFGREDSEFGWKIEQIAAGAQSAENLRPFQWRNGYDIAERARIAACAPTAPAFRPKSTRARRATAPPRGKV
jgi:hypothetical protein